MKKKIIIVMVIALILFAGIRVITSCYENKHRENNKNTYTSWVKISK